MAILSCYKNRSAAVLIQVEKTNFNLLLTSLFTRPLNSKLSIWSLTTMKRLCIQSSWNFLTTYFHKGIYICARIDQLFCNIHMSSLARNKQWGPAVLEGEDFYFRFLNSKKFLIRDVCVFFRTLVRMQLDNPPIKNSPLTHSQLLHQPL